ncbi:alpha-L-fucosidase [Chitinophaga pendula]|uniref:alpha-L-fucosidase n=1 Tax=Chitinophaga TaxID=79328 RepID=UPI000BB0AAF4|nr:MULTISPECIES: alpha-L-fucosidase [Chitinophaga]ASZ11056.1 alpha-L-fucosidase [Chitinophaga sp. MD30]UCJ05947.1 alpha-L-fucosidase [Chitinophaga pendula]
MRKIVLLFLLSITTAHLLPAQDMKDMWTKEAGNNPTHPGLKWFRNAKFGLFIHWGLYAKLGGRWKDSSYYGSGEWIMNRAKIPAETYARIADDFNPTGFNASEWASLAKDAGVKYLVITAKHHEGFSMYDSKVSDFNIVRASPYAKDPLKALAEACRQKGVQFGCYYSQFQDWHEPNGGGNRWDFDDKKKNYRQYYQDKAIPQLKELLTNYGPLGIIWFDTPGGLSKEETKQMIDSLRLLQPNCLFSSRVGHGLGDYKDFGDSEVPTAPITGAWESIYTHNDSWGYISHDLNFKSPTTIIRLLANVASKRGNLMLNVGPDGNGQWPHQSREYLLETGKWLKKYGESIYNTTYGLIPAQPWGVTTSGLQCLYLHVWQMPTHHKLIVPYMQAKVTAVRWLDTNVALPYRQRNDELEIQLPPDLPDARSSVIKLEYKGVQPDSSAATTRTVSQQYKAAEIPVVAAEYSGNTQSKVFTFSHYYGDWKHEQCLVNMKDSMDALSFSLLVQEAGDYSVVLDYACPPAAAGREGVVEIAGQQLSFLSLPTGEYDTHAPLLFIQHRIGVIRLPAKGKYTLRIKPAKTGRKELFRLRSVVLEP